MNVQFSYEDDSVGLDWVLLGPSNIRDKKRIENYLESQKFEFEYKESNDVNYIRVTKGDLTALCRKIMSELYGVNSDDLFAVYYQGINLEKYVEQK